jgi:NADPH2:quinone reductase
VVAAASTRQKVDLALARGAASGVVYPPGSFDHDGRKALAELFKQACGPDGADVIYDGVGGDYAEAALRAIAWEGRFLVVGFPAGIPKLPLNLTLLKSCQVIGVFLGGAIARDRGLHQRNAATLLDLYEAGKIRPHVSETFPLGARRGGDRPSGRPQGARQGRGDHGLNGSRP